MPITNYYWDVDTDNVVLEEDENGNTIAEYTQEPSLYGELIAQERDGQASFYNFDGQGSTRELTDQNQNVTDTYTYDAFGVEVARTGTTVNPFGYEGALGYHANAVKHDFYSRARIYNSQTARWLSADPLLYYDGINFYRFARCNPVNNSDPSGFAVTCSAQHCSQTYPGPNEGVFLFSVEIVGTECGIDTKAKFRLVDSKYTPGIFRRSNRGRGPFLECGQPANDEADDASATGWNWRYGNIVKRGCTMPEFHGEKDSHGCWVLKWEWECPIDCLDGLCQPNSFGLGIYGPPGSGLDAFGLKVFANVKYNEACCILSGCSIATEAGWYWDVRGRRRRYPDLYKSAPNNCTPAQRQQMGVAP